MIGADVGLLSKHIEREVSPSGLMVALRLVDGELAGTLMFALDKVLYIFLREKMLEALSEITYLFHIRIEEGNECALHFAIGHCVHELSLRLMLNVGPTCGIVGAAHGAEAEPNHIDVSATESKRGIPVELHDPATFDCANSIKQKPW